MYRHIYDVWVWSCTHKLLIVFWQIFQPESHQGFLAQTNGSLLVHCVSSQQLSAVSTKVIHMKVSIAKSQILNYVNWLIQTEYLKIRLYSPVVVILELSLNLPHQINSRKNTDGPWLEILMSSISIHRCVYIFNSKCLHFVYALCV